MDCWRAKGDIVKGDVGLIGDLIWDVVGEGEG